MGPKFVEHKGRRVHGFKGLVGLFSGIQEPRKQIRHYGLRVYDKGILGFRSLGLSCAYTLNLV